MPQIEATIYEKKIKGKSRFYADITYADGRTETKIFPNCKSIKEVYIKLARLK
jgi:hypothetical protein